jgi:hypothetical protein
MVSSSDILHVRILVADDLNPHGDQTIRPRVEHVAPDTSDIRTFEVALYLSGKRVNREFGKGERSFWKATDGCKAQRPPNPSHVSGWS